MKQTIYLDYNATTPCDPRVVEEMLPFFTEKYGNAASRNHPYGWIASEAVDKSREQVAQLLKVDPKEITFTSGATESINLAIKGIHEMYQVKGSHIITVQTEHKAVLDTCEYLEKQGAEVTYLPVDQNGLVILDSLRESITDRTILVSIMWVNNETGVIQPMKEIAEICNEKGVLLFSDATQAVGKIATNPKDMGIHMMAFSGHKFYGPKGIGGLYTSRRNPRVRLAPQIHGGGHERGFRSGTLNVTGIVGLGKAAEIAELEMQSDQKRLSELRDYLQSELLTNIELTTLNGAIEQRLGHTTNIQFGLIDSEALMMTFNQKIAVSSGSACTTESLDPSHVLVAMGLTSEQAQGSIRFSLGKYTTRMEIEQTVEAVIKGVTQLREKSPIWEMYKDGIDVLNV